MSAGRITRVSREQARKMKGSTDWERVDKLTDEEIEAAVADDPDAFLADDEWWSRAVLVPPGVAKKRVSLRLDEDVIAWYRQQGRGYHHVVNHALRHYMQNEGRRAQAAQQEQRKASAAAE